MSYARLVITNTQNTSVTFNDVLSFSFRKDVYLPYTTLTARVQTNVTNYYNSAEVKLYLGNLCVHHGLIDSLTSSYGNGKTTMTISSRSFTSLLCQNQIEPGIHTNITINDLMDNFYSFPNVTHENNSVSSYIFVKGNSTMWDALVNLSYKVCGNYPYIRGTNKIMMSQYPSPSSFTLTSSQIVSLGSELTLRRMHSNYHMSDINGDYGNYDYTDPDAASRRIVRHKYFELDRQFLYAPQGALEYRAKFDSRGFIRHFCTYCGYSGEDIGDLITFRSFCGRRIGSVEVTGSSKGIFTELSIYDDKFTQ